MCSAASGRPQTGAASHIYCRKNKGMSQVSSLFFLQEITKQVKIFAKSNLDQEKTLGALIHEYNLNDDEVKQLASNLPEVEATKVPVDNIKKITTIFFWAK